MTKTELNTALAEASTAALTAGNLMRKHLRSTKKINVESRHDIKLELDVRCQALIERRLHRAFLGVAILGEEGTLGDPQSECRWVVDPIDGTVNFSYGIPHSCVSIALQVRRNTPTQPFRSPRFIGHADALYETVVGVVYDPFCNELWTATRGSRARLNGIPISASRRAVLAEAIVAIGFAKERHTLQRMIPTLNSLLHRVRKIRIMGAAALSLVYVASGRMDAYLEYGLRLWDIAAGGLILERAGGDYFHEPVTGKHRYRLLANNGRLRKKLLRL
jgi:myo-inositol-1(or 4)-monophosphatase